MQDTGKQEERQKAGRELCKAHTAKDKAIMSAHGFDIGTREAECAAVFMMMYQVLINSKR